MRIQLKIQEEHAQMHLLQMDLQFYTVIHLFLLNYEHLQSIFRNQNLMS